MHVHQVSGPNAHQRNAHRRVAAPLESPRAGARRALTCGAPTSPTAALSSPPPLPSASKNSVVSNPGQTPRRPRDGAPPLAHADAPRHTRTGNSAATRKPAPHHRAAGGRPLRALATISQQKTKRCKRQDAREQATARSLRAPFALRIHALIAAPLFTRSIMVCYSPMSSGPASRASVETRSVLCVSRGKSTQSIATTLCQQLYQDRYIVTVSCNDSVLPLPGGGTLAARDGEPGRVAAELQQRACEMCVPRCAPVP